MRRITVPITVRQANASEQGIALAMAIMLMLLTTITIAAIGMAITSTSQDNHDRAQRVLDTPAADGAIDRYTFGLRSGVITDGNDFMLEQHPSSDPNTMQLTALAGAPQDVIPDTGDPSTFIPVADRSVYGVYRAGALMEAMPADALYTMMVPIDPSQLPAGTPAATAPASFWQVLRIDLPDYGTADPNLVVYFRTWTATTAGQNATQAHVLRAEFRTGGFGQYQLLADGPIALASGLTMDGPVHSNGYNDDPLHPAATDSILFDSGVSCSSNAIFTTSQGSISGAPGSCKNTANTGKYVSFLSAETSFKDMWKACSSPYQPLAYCYGYTGTTHTVTVSNQQACVQWTGPVPFGTTGKGCQRIESPTSLGSSMMFHDNVSVIGGGQPVDARFTIGTHLPFGPPIDNDTPVPGASDIHIESSVGVATDPLASFGLMAQGDVIIDQPLSTPCQTTEIDAAIVAETGRLTIPPQYATTDMVPGTPYPECRTTPLIVHGSVAGHFGPTTKWQIGSTVIGYANRSYVYDPRYKDDSPPFFPLSDQWQLADWRAANLDCFTDPSATLPQNLPTSCR